VTLADALRSCTRALDASSDSPQADARLLLAHALGCDSAWLIAHEREAIDGAARARLDALVARRATGEPIAYVLGSAWFYGREFVVTRDVLVPRPETEHLVEAVLDDLRAGDTHPAGRLRVCDVGTGSGAIALTVAAENPGIEVVASDASEPALAVARLNAARLGVEERVRFVAGDLAAPLEPLGPYDCLVANLPYVPSRAVPAPPDPVGFEPRFALDGGEDGLALYRRLLEGLARLLAPGGSAFLEAAPGTIERLAVLAESLLGAHVEIGEDYAGKERWVSVTLP
jgi:release factor glutamine methyltransferase